MLKLKLEGKAFHSVLSTLSDPVPYSLPQMAGVVYVKVKGPFAYFKLIQEIIAMPLTKKPIKMSSIQSIIKV